MTTYTVTCDIGTVYATVEADDEDAAISEAITKWDQEAVEIFAAGTFGVQGDDDAA